MSEDKGFSVKALATLATGMVLIVLNKDDKQPTKQELLSHSDISFKGIGTIMVAVGGLWFLASIISKK